MTVCKIYISILMRFMANKLGRLLTLGGIFSTQRLSRHRLLVAIEIWRKHYTDFEIQKALQISITKFQVMWAFGTHVASIDYIACRIIMQPFYNFDIIFDVSKNGTFNVAFKAWVCGRFQVTSVLARNICQWKRVCVDFCFSEILQ